MSEERGTLPRVVAETLSHALEQVAQTTIQQLEAGSPTAQALLEGLFTQAGQLVHLVNWAVPPGEEDWWAVRAGELVCLGGPQSFSLTLTPNSLVMGELLSVVRSLDGDLMVDHRQQSWAVRAQGTVVSAVAMEEALERSFDKWEQGLTKLDQVSPGHQASASAAPLSVPQSGSWMAELLGPDSWKSWLATAVSTGAAVLARQAVQPAVQPAAPARSCSECGQVVPADARFCHNCGKPMVLQNCPQCQAPLVTGSHYCAECGGATG